MDGREEALRLALQRVMDESPSSNKQRKLAAISAEIEAIEAEADYPDWDMDDPYAPDASR